MSTGVRCSVCGEVCGSRKEPPVCAACAKKARAEEQAKENKRKKRYAREHPIEEYIGKLRSRGFSYEKIATEVEKHYPPPPPPWGGARWTMLDVILAYPMRSWKFYDDDVVDQGNLDSEEAA